MTTKSGTDAIHEEMRKACKSNVRDKEKTLSRDDNNMQREKS